jgi:hypothetical protein
MKCWIGSIQTEMVVGFSNLAAVYPKTIVTGMPCCICTAHQNVRLMLEGLVLLHLTTDS